MQAGGTLLLMGLSNGIAINGIALLWGGDEKRHEVLLYDPVAPLLFMHMA